MLIMKPQLDRRARFICGMNEDAFSATGSLIDWDLDPCLFVSNILVMDHGLCNNHYWFVLVVKGCIFTSIWDK
jgi:hypothetical protein